MKNTLVCSDLPRLFYSAREVSQMLNVDEKTVYRLIQRGLLKASVALRHKRIPAQSISEFVETTTNGGSR
jgi:excisionase family DNA binding protein